MLATSMKTDEELADNALVPEILTFRPVSPYVKKPITPVKPSDVTTKRWDEMLPQLTSMASAAIARFQKTRPPQASIEKFDDDAHRASAASRLVNDLVAKIDRRLWIAETDKPLIDEFRSLLTDDAVSAALSDALARLELFTFQLRTLDLHIYNLTEGADFADTWHVESGPAKLFKTGNTTRLSYHFDSPASDPIVLRHDFRLPPGVKSADLHKLILSTGADNSWHRVNAIFDVAGERWESDAAIAIAQYRPLSLLFQPPTFDDELMRAKVWTSLQKTGPSPPSSDAKIAGEGEPATLRITITPSSTIRANYEKARRNYVRAFQSVPFWRYITNSVVLVALCTLGSLFSASFVAYAFARLNWPGRSIAFLVLLSTMMLPGQVTMIPGFMIWRAVHWYNTLNPLWVPAFFGSAFFIFLMTQQMKTIPKELEEAARLDGLNALQSWYYVILPQVKPVLAAIAILSFIGAWNDFLGPLIYLRDQTKFPLSLGLYGLGLLRAQGGADYNWTVVMAGNMLMTVPVIVVFFLFQRYFVQGMTLTGMKG
jgi:multiple sugar transport system permease protein